MRFRVVLEESEEGGYTAYVPSLPGCISEGETKEEALKNIQEAIERPRFLLGRSALSEPNDTLRLEGRIDRRVAQQLAEMGHNVEIMDDWYHRAGHAHGVVKRGATWMGGADPRTEGLALGF